MTLYESVFVFVNTKFLIKTFFLHIQQYHVLPLLNSSTDISHTPQVLQIQVSLTV